MQAICTVQRRYKSLPSFNLFFHHQEKDSYTCPITHCQLQYRRPINNVLVNKQETTNKKKSRYQTKHVEKKQSQILERERVKQKAVQICLLNNSKYQYGIQGK